MTQRNRNPLAFSSTSRRQLVAEFSGGSITSDAGLLLLREANRQIGLLDAVNAANPRCEEVAESTVPQKASPNRVASRGERPD